MFSWYFSVKVAYSDTEKFALHGFLATSLCRICHRVCKSMRGPILGLYAEHLIVAFRDIGFIRSQTRRNTTTSTIAEGNINITPSIFVRSRQQSTTYQLKCSSNVALFRFGVNSSRLRDCKTNLEYSGYFQNFS